VTEDVGKDAQDLIPQAVQIFVDVDNLALAAVEDSGAALSAIAKLIGAVVTAAENKALNIADDEAVVTAVQGVISSVLAVSKEKDLLTAINKLVVDWDTFGAACEAALKKLDADARG
jgi:hypothetical protein